MKTAEQYEQKCITERGHYWIADEDTCDYHGMCLNKQGQCNECLDDYHESWIMQRTDIA